VLGIAAVCVLSSGFQLSSPVALRAALDDPLLQERAAEHVERVATADLLAGRMDANRYRNTVQSLARTLDRDVAVETYPR
jgi:hypothetical protein